MQPAETDFPDPMREAGWELLPQKMIWWPAEGMLIVSDLHLGKAGHFRKHGIAVPNAVNADTLKRLDSMVRQYRPRCLLVLGDLFHSDENAEWGEFKSWLSSLQRTDWFDSFVLVEGNHDVLPSLAFEGIEVKRTERWQIGNLVFAHDPADLSDLQSGETGVAGHLHPALRMKGKGRQSLKLPCWWYNGKDRVLVVPTFGTFTGSVAVSPTKGDRCWVTTGDAVVAVPID